MRTHAATGLIALAAWVLSTGHAHGLSQTSPSRAQIITHAEVVFAGKITKIIPPAANDIATKQKCYSIAQILVTDVFKGSVKPGDTVSFVYWSHELKSSSEWFKPDKYQLNSREMFALGAASLIDFDDPHIGVARGAEQVKFRNRYRAFEHQKVQSAAFRKLATIWRTPEIGLTDTDPAVVAGAIELSTHLAKVPSASKKLQHAILQGMQSDHTELQAMACSASSHVPREEVIAVAIAHLKKTRSAGNATTLVLARIGIDAVHPLMELAGDQQDPKLRVAAIQTLGTMLQIGDGPKQAPSGHIKDVQAFLVSHLNDKDGEVAYQAAAALGSSFAHYTIAAEHLPAVVSAFQLAKSPGMQETLATCLVQNFDRPGLQALWRFLKDDDQQRAGIAVKVVNNWSRGNPIHLAQRLKGLPWEPLKIYLDRNPPTALNIHHTQTHLTQAFRDGRAVPYYARIWRQNQCPSALNVIGNIGGPTAVKFLAPLTANADPLIAAMATYSLCWTREPELATAAMAAARSHPEATVRIAAARGALAFETTYRATLTTMLKQERDATVRKTIETLLRDAKPGRDAWVGYFADVHTKASRSWMQRNK